MKLEDALLYLVVEVSLDDRRDIGLLCEGAIAGGVDILELRPAGNSDAVKTHIAAGVDACRREDALSIVTNDTTLAAETGAGGVLINDINLAFGTVKASLDPSQIVGVSTRTLDDAMLALEMGPDYVTHYAGTECVGHFGSLKFMAGIPLYAAGLQDFSQAESLTAGGIFRFCVHWKTGDGDNVTERMIEYSRLLGRSM